MSVREDHLERRPANLSFEQAAALPTSGLAALHGLRDAGKVRRGDKVLINGASGGVGTFAVQIAKSLGAEVTGVCSTANVELVRSLGADHVIDYNREDFTLGERRYDVILDNVENRALRACRRALTPTGTLVLNSGTGARGIKMLARLIKQLVVSPFVRQRLRRYLSVPNYAGDRGRSRAHREGTRARQGRGDGALSERGRRCHGGVTEARGRARLITRAGVSRVPGQEVVMSDTPPRPAIAALRALAFTAAAAVTAGCGGSSDGDGGNDPSASAELNDLASFPAPAPDHDRATGPATVTQGEDAVCTRTPYSLSSAPRDVVMFNADPQVLWPGALIVGHSYRDGALELLPIAERAPVRLSIQGLYADQTAVTVPAPTGSAVTAAVNRLLAQAVRDHTVPTNSIEYTQTSAYNLDQAALKVGLSARYLGARARASLNVSTSSSESSVVAHALVRMFTVAVDAPATPDGFFHGLTAESLAAQEALGRIGEGNAPVYVASVTYGQIMMFSATASASASEIKAALSASFNGFAGGGSGSLSAAHKELLGSASIDVVTLGGSGGAVRGMILSGTPADFFVGTDLITSAVPIAYTLKDLSGRVAKVAETSEYTLETCTENGLADLYVVNAGGGLGGGTVTGYYPNGARAPLNVAIAGLTAPQGIAYDALDDALFVLDFAGGTRPRLRAFAPDGSPAQVVTAASPFPGLSSPSGVTYDTRLGRLYVVDVADGSGLGIVRAYTPRGEALNLFFSTPTPAFASHAIAHDPQRRRIYVTRSTRSEGGGFVTVFEDDGTDVTPAGSFPGLRLPEGVAIDPATGRVYVSDYFAGTVLAFDPDGTPIPLAHPISGLRLPRGLAYDPETGQLYVAVEGASTIEVFRPDGTPVASLATPAFPDVSSPEGIVLR